MSKIKFLFVMITITLMFFSFAANSLADSKGGIIHDAEHYILEAQHGEKWVAEDKAISQKLA